MNPNLLRTETQRIAWFTWAAFVFYVLLLVYFAEVDVYHRYFFANGLIVLCYNFARVFFILCFMWLFYSIGDRFLSYWAYAKESDNLDSLLLAFFAGVSICHLVLLFVGFAGFYNRTLITICSIFLFFLSLRRLDYWLKLLNTNVSSFYLPGALLLILAIGLLLISKGLYPAGGHDYYIHYFHFYRKVIETGSILPNEIWYHFYYSKGAALFFLSMLLTDPLAPQLATTAFVLAGAGIVFSVLKQASWRLLPWIGAALYLVFLTYTPGPFGNMLQGGWGDFEKPHEPASIMMLTLIWIVIRLAKTHAHRSWGITLILSTIALILISPVMVVFAAAYLSMAAIYFFMRGNNQASIWTIAAVGTAVITGGFLLGMNYLLSGLPQDQGLFVFWPIVNFKKIQAWGVLFELLMIHWGKTVLAMYTVPLSLNLLLKILTYLRLDVWGPLCLSSLVLFAVGISFKPYRNAISKQLDRDAFYAFSGFLLLVCGISFVIGRDQPISFYRFTTFSYAPMLCVCLLLIAATLKNRFTSLLIFSLGWISAWFMLQSYMNFNKVNIKMVGINSLHFALGHYSLADAYRHQQGWPGRMPWGGIYPAAETIWRQLPSHTRIWSLHIHSYCMLPDCHIEGYPSFRLSPRADIIYYGLPAAAKAQLQLAHLNYFFFSTALNLTDPLPRAPLFSPKNIAQFLGIAWTDGDNTLLTWKEQAKFPIDKRWLQRYERSLNNSPSVKVFPYEALRSGLEKVYSQGKVASNELPWYGK